MSNQSDNIEDPRERFRRIVSSQDSGSTPDSTVNMGFNSTDTQPIRKGSSQPKAQEWELPTEIINTPPVGNTKPIKTGKQPKKNRNDFEWKSFGGWILKASLIGIFSGVVLVLCVISVMFYQYYQIASQLPDISDISQNASTFETTRILDRNGNVLYEILDPNAGRRTYVPLGKISPYLIAATIATEDKSFYRHPGFDLLGIARAFVQNIQSGETVSGASTITQQLARTILFSPDEQYEKTYRRKIREAILAAEITRRYPKEKILELYLNEIYYGNLAYGIQAAAETYFHTSADQLTLGQASFLAGLPQAPGIYDVFTRPEVTFERHEDVLVLMYQLSQEESCIFVSNNPEKVCISPIEVTNSAQEVKTYQFEPPMVQMRNPHWVTYIKELLEAQFESQIIYRSGFTVYTTIDPELQALAEKTVADQVESLSQADAHGGALVAIQPATGQILAMVGSPDFYNEQYSGQVNMAINPRQPGSSIKPLTYLAAFEKGWTPSSLLWDVPSEFSPSGIPEDPSDPYVPVNYDGRFHGPVLVRSALANSYNIPAVKTLEYVGIYDNPDTPEQDGFISFAKKMGITTLNRPDYGLSLTLGGGEVTLLELTSAYATLANSGRRIPPVAITKILDYRGNVIFDYQQPSGEQVVRDDHAYLISSILADNEARTPAFGSNSVLNLPFQAAAKTGTTNDFRDNWTLGYTPDLAVGVWVGNPDYSAMQNTTGVTGAAPIWSTFIQKAEMQLTGGNPTPINRPGGIVDKVICKISGSFPSKWCPNQSNEIFASDQPPLPEDDDLWKKVVINTWNNLRASNDCPEFTDEKLVLNVSDQWARRWIRKDPNGQAWADQIGFSRPVTFIPSRECKLGDPIANLVFGSPRDGDTISVSPLEVYVIADASDWFDYVRLDYGIGSDPDEWQALDQWRNPFGSMERIYSWDLTDFPPGIITLRLFMHSVEDTVAEKVIHLNIQVPTPTPTPTATPTETPTPTLTLIPSETPTETLPPVDTPTPTVTETPPPP